MPARLVLSKHACRSSVTSSQSSCCFLISGHACSSGNSGASWIFCRFGCSEAAGWLSAAAWRLPLAAGLDLLCFVAAAEVVGLSAAAALLCAAVAASACGDLLSQHAIFGMAVNTQQKDLAKSTFAALVAGALRFFDGAVSAAGGSSAFSLLLFCTAIVRL